MARGKKAAFILAVVSMWIGTTNFAFASKNPGATRDELMSIARQFVTRVGGKLDQAKMKQKSAGAVDALTQIPDGETLLFLPRSGKILYDSEIQAIKDRGGIYISLDDMINILELAINYDPAKQRASGWYLREDWPVVFDARQKTVFYRGKNFKMNDADFLIDNEGLLYFNTKALISWLDLDLNIVFAEQVLEVKTPYPLPAVDRDDRKNRQIAKNDANMPVLPRKPSEYKWLDINTADVSARAVMDRAPDEKTQFRESGSLAIEGQALKHTVLGIASYDKDEHLTGVTARMSKQNEDPVLLGPLKARSYSFGDIQTAEVPLTGNANQEAGFRVSNNPLQNSDFQKTTIDGDALPGWDAELYRGGVLLGRLQVPPDGHYEFPEVQLFAGDNDFEVVFYGPQGERRTETLEVPVNAALLATQDGTYDVSVGLKDSKVYEPQEFSSDNEDKNTPDITARYNKYIGDTLVYGGLKANQVEGNQKLIAGTGFTKIWNNILFDGNFALDEQGEAAAELSARRNIFDWQLATSILANTDGYAPLGEDNPQTLGLTASVLRQFMPFEGQTATFTANGQYTEDAAGQNLVRGNTGLSYQVGRLNMSNTLDYSKRGGGDAPIVEPENLTDTFFARANLGKTSVRAGVDYRIKPENRVESYFADVDYRPNDKVTTNVGLTHRPVDNFTEGEASLSYINDKVRTSPFISYNSDQELQAGVNVNFDLVKAPNKFMPTMTSQRLIGRGLVSSFVYHDKNGNDIFDAGDEPLPDVVVESVNIKRRESTDEKGYSLIKDLPNTRATDIHVDNSTLPDPFMISGFEGVSIFPSPGEMVELEFPVHLAGEIDGVVNTFSGDGVSQGGARANIMLLPIDGKVKKPVETQSAADGYFTASQVPPGTYLLTVTDRTAKRLKAAAETPSVIQINYDGTILSQDIRLVEGRNNVPITMQMVYGGVREGVPSYMMKVRQGGKSQLLSLLRRFAMTRATKDLFSGIETVDAVGEKEEGVTYYKVPSNDMAETHRRCQSMVDQGVSCEMMIFVRDRKLTPVKTALK